MLRERLGLLQYVLFLFLFFLHSLLLSGNNDSLARQTRRSNPR
jgi:hypothetical protein